MADVISDKRFHIKNSISSLVLEVPKVKVEGKVTENTQKKDSSQYFYYDHLNKVIRTYKNGFCLDVITSTNKVYLVVNPFNPENIYQRWRLEGDSLINIEAKLAVHSSDTKQEDITCQSLDAESKISQWSFERSNPKYFLLRNREVELILEVTNKKKEAGSAVGLNKSKRIMRDHQEWYEESNGTIRSRLKGLVLDVTGGKLVVNQQDDLNPWQKWQILDGQIINLTFPDKVLSIAAEEGTLKNVIVQDKDFSLMRQKWRVEYV